MMHTCYTGAAGVLMEGLAGFSIRGTDIVVRPYLSADLPAYDAWTETLYGTLSLSVRRDADGSFEVVVKLPHGCRGVLRAKGDRPLRPGLNRFTKLSTGLAIDNLQKN